MTWKYRTYNLPEKYTRKEVCPICTGQVAPIVCFDGVAYTDDGRGGGYVIIGKCNNWEKMCQYR